MDYSGGCWAWKDLELDGYSHPTPGTGKISLLEVKSSSDLSKATRQLSVRTRFIDNVATFADCGKFGIPELDITKLAVVHGVDERSSLHQTTQYEKITRMTLTVKQVEF
jgi:hypothetical protein